MRRQFVTHDGTTPSAAESLAGPPTRLSNASNGGSYFDMHGICTNPDAVASPEMHPGLCRAYTTHASYNPGMGKTQHRKDVGENLRLAIEAVGETQASICRAFKVTPSNLGNWLRGDSYPSEWFVVQFCDRYDISADWIYRGKVSASAAPLADALWKAQETKRAAQMERVLQAHVSEKD